MPLRGANRYIGAALAALVLALASAATWAAPAPDVVRLIEDTPSGDLAPLVAALPQLRGGDAALVRARIAAERLDLSGVRAALAEWRATGDRDPHRQSIAFSAEADAAFAAGEYAEAADAITAALALPVGTMRSDEVASSRQTLGVARALAHAPRQSVEGGTPGAGPPARDKLKLLRGTVTINGRDEDAVFDTGGNLSLVSATGAKKLGLRVLDDEVSVGSPGSADIPSHLAVADRLTIAGVTLRNVVFLVMDDAKLSFPVPGGYSIEALIGFPVFRALGRIGFDKAGHFIAGGPRLSGSPNLTAMGNDLFVEARVNGLATPLFIDTGATDTALTSRFAELHRPMLASLPVTERRVMGAGNKMLAQPAVKLAPVTLQIGDAQATLPEITVATASEKREDKLGSIGQDVLGQFAAYAIDFRTMRFEPQMASGH